MACKINAKNYQFIHNSVIIKGVATTSKAYGIDKTTARRVGDFKTFEEYKSYITKLSQEQYQRRLEKQRKMKEKKMAAAQSKPFESSYELGRAKTITTTIEKEKENKVEETKTPQFTMFKKEQNKNSNSQKWPSMDNDRLNIAIGMARVGEIKQTIAERLGYPNVGTMMYHMDKNPEYTKAFRLACKQGEAKYRKNFSKLVLEGKHRTKTEQKEQPKVEKPVEKPVENKQEPDMPKALELSNELKQQMLGHTTETKSFTVLPEYRETSKDYLIKSIGGFIRVVSIGVLTVLFGLTVMIIANALK